MGLPNSPMQGSRLRVCSGNFVTARPIGVVDGIDFQHTGKVRRIDTSGIQRQLQDGSIVLLSPLGYSPTGEIFSLALEDIAVQCAAAIGADKLIDQKRHLILFGCGGQVNTEGHCTIQGFRVMSIPNLAATKAGTTFNLSHVSSHQ